MKIYNKNDFSKYYKKQDSVEVIDTYMSTFRKSNHNSILNSTAFTDCQKSIGKSTISSRIDVSTAHNKQDTKTKYINYTNILKSEQNHRHANKEESHRRNIDLTNIKYSDIRNTLSIMTFLPRFKSMSKYNKTTQELLTTPRSNPINIYTRVKELNKYIYQ
jgi:hypothetical protein